MHKQGNLNNSIAGNSHTFIKKIHTFSASIFLLTSLSITTEAAETVAPAPPTWGLDPVTGTLLVPGIVTNTMGKLDVPRSAADGDHMLKLFDTRSATLAANRPVQTPDAHTHHNWDIGSIGNVFGLAIDNERNIFTTASVHYSAFFGFSFGNEADISFGSIGAGVTPDTAGNDNNPGTLNDISAAGAVYKLDKITGDVSLFASLPQTARSFTQQGCEGTNDIARNTGPSLGNIAYDSIHNQLFITNFEDGTIYRYDASTPAPAGGYTAADALSVFQPAGFSGLVPNGTTTTGGSPYGIAVNPSGNKLYFGTNEINTSPRLFSIDLDSFGDFSGPAVNQNATLGTDLAYTQNIGGTFVNNGDEWVSYSDLQFSPAGELIVGIRTGCNGNLATSHNHGGAYYLLKQDAGGLYNTPADKVPGNSNPAGDGNYDAGSIPIYTDQNTGVGDNGTGPDDGYGGVAIYDKGDGSYDYLVTSSDMTVETGPHGFMLFQDDFTINTSASNLVGPLASFPSLPSSTTTGPVDYKGIGGDLEVLSVLVDWGDAPDTYSTDLITGNATGGADVRGPTHILTADGIILGSTVDHEFNGVPSINAEGDDNASTPDDEDGISAFPALPPGTSSYTIPIADISAANASGGDVTIHAWIDFDGNGTFDADEYTTTTVANGATAPNADLEWTGAGVSGVTGNTTYARFRITNDPAINANIPGGPALNGEVEDYAINVVSIGSIIWNDSNLDGMQTAGESGIAGAQVVLLDSTGNPAMGVAPQTTGADGLYHFSGLPEGNYSVRVTMPAGYAPTINQTTANNNDAENDSNIASSAGNVHTSGTYTLDLDLEPSVDSNIVGSDDADNSEETRGNMTVDFGFIQLGSWSGNVSRDDNNDDTGDTICQVFRLPYTLMLITMVFSQRVIH